MHRVAGAEGRDALIRTVDALNSGKPGFKFIPSPTFHVLHGGIEAVGDVLDGLMDEGVDIADVACITPYVANIDALNTAVRYRWFPETLEDGDDAPVWYVGARVMQTENNPKTGLMNGMEGLIVDVNEVDEELTVEFEMFLNEPDAVRRDDGRLFKCFTYRIGTHPNKVEPDGVTLEWAKGKSIEEQTKEKKQRDEQDAAPDLYTSELAISFGATIHKQQGSEYPIIVFYCPASAANGHFLTRELVNVAITRAKKRVFVVGDIQAIEAAVARPVPRRQAFLAERLIEMRGAK
jgi:ATP-dependent exoDNAse (exonuclease V) alpha subunit